MDRRQKTLITIVGPTAIGKTSLSISLAKHFKTEIISCDSRQCYKEMTIGTAVPHPEELIAVPHHFIQNRSIFKEYNAGLFELDALKTLEELFKKFNILIMVGGSGLYIDAVLNGFNHFPKVDQSIRNTLQNQLKIEGISALQKQLKQLDLKSYHSIALENPQRVIRALEICIGTNLPYSSFKEKPIKKRAFKSIKIGLYANRQKIYDRIDQRVDEMLQEGLIKEAYGLYPNKELNALQTVGYKELFSFFDKKISRAAAIEEIKKNTRRFAKRQLTWFRKDTSILWFDFKEDLNTIVKKIKAHF